MMKVCIFLKKNGNAKQPPPLNRIKMHSPISRRRCCRKYYIVTNGPFTPYFYFCGMCSMNREMGPQAHIDFSLSCFSSFTSTTVRKREMETTSNEPFTRHSNYLLDYSRVSNNRTFGLIKRSHSIHMLSIQIDIKSLELVIHHQSFFASNMKSCFPLCTFV